MSSYLKSAHPELAHEVEAAYYSLDLDDRIPLFIGEFRITAILGRGREAQVVLGISGFGAGDAHAIKFVHRDEGREPLDRISKESAIIHKVHAHKTHPHIVAPPIVGDAGGVRYMAMPVIRGMTLLEAGQLSAAATCAMGVQLSGALQQIHGAGCLHLDISPSNVRLQGYAKGDPPHAVLMDFGLAEDRSDGNNPFRHVSARGGTLGFCSPEHGLVRKESPAPRPEAIDAARNEDREPCVDDRSDIFSLGCVMGLALSGVDPSDKHINHAAFADKIRCCDHATPQLRNAVLKAISLNPCERFRSAAEFHKSLLAVGEASTTEHGENICGKQSGSSELGAARAAHRQLVIVPTLLIGALALFHTLRQLPAVPPILFAQAFALSCALGGAVIGVGLALDLLSWRLQRRALDDLLDSWLGHWGRVLTSIGYVPEWHKSFERKLDKAFGSRLISLKSLRRCYDITVASCGYIGAFVAMLACVTYPELHAAARSYPFHYLSCLIGLVLSAALMNIPFDFASVLATRHAMRKIRHSSMSTVAVWIALDLIVSLACSLAPVACAAFLAGYAGYSPDQIFSAFPIARPELAVMIFSLSSICTGMFLTAWLWLYMLLWGTSTIGNFVLGALGLTGRLLEYFRVFLSLAVFLALLSGMGLCVVTLYLLLSQQSD